MSNDLAERLAHNIRHLRELRGFTQQQMAKHSGLPRATWANLESGLANPTLAVLTRVAVALQVSIEELISAPRSTTRVYPFGTLPMRKNGEVTVRRLFPDRVPGVLMERLELPAGARMTGVPHTAGTREYLTCETGTITLVAGGEQFTINAGDVVVFKGDQKHSYANSTTRTAVGYSMVMLQPVVG